MYATSNSGADQFANPEYRISCVETHHMNQHMSDLLHMRAAKVPTRLCTGEHVNEGLGQQLIDRCASTLNKLF